MTSMEILQAWTIIRMHVLRLKSDIAQITSGGLDGVFLVVKSQMKYYTTIIGMLACFLQQLTFCFSGLGTIITITNAKLPRRRTRGM